MASYLSHPSTILSISRKKPEFRPTNHQITLSFLQNGSPRFISKPFLTNKTSPRLNPCSTTPKSSFSSSSTSNTNDFLEKDENLPLIKDSSVKFVFWVILWASVSVALFAFSPGDSKAQTAVQSIKASSFGIKFANFLRGSGWPDEAVVFALATLPVIELRGAIPVGYWLQLKPLLLTALSVLGNMVP